MYSYKKWFHLFLGVLGLSAISLYLIEGKSLYSFIAIVLLTIFYFISCIYYFIKDAPYKKTKHNNSDKINNN